MTENETIAVRFIENIKNHAMVTLDHIAKEEPSVSPLVYKGREEKADTILTMVEELKQYRQIGTLEECRTAVEKQTARKGIREKIKKGYNRGMHHYYCPVCYEKGDLRKKYNVGLYCSDCGQKLDWEDEE